MALEEAGAMPALPGSLEGRRVLFISYNGMLDPLGQSQVIPYLRELSKRGVRFTLLSFERAGAFGSVGQAKSAGLRKRLAEDDVQDHQAMIVNSPGTRLVTSGSVIHPEGLGRPPSAA